MLSILLLNIPLLFFFSSSVLKNSYNLFKFDLGAIILIEQKILLNSLYIEIDSLEELKEDVKSYRVEEVEEKNKNMERLQKIVSARGHHDVLHLYCIKDHFHLSKILNVALKNVVLENGHVN